MSPPSISTWGWTFSCFNIALGATISYSFIMSNHFLLNSTSILLTFVVDVFVTSTPTCTCSSIFTLKVNVATFSTPTYVCCLITIVSKSLSFIAATMSCANLVEACWLKAVVLLSFQVSMYQKQKEHKSKIRTTSSRKWKKDHHNNALIKTKKRIRAKTQDWHLVEVTIEEKIKCCCSTCFLQAIRKSLSFKPLAQF